MGSQLSIEYEVKNEVTFTLCGKQHTVRENCNITPTTSLNTYLRDVACLRDTKAMCKEGGCGACIVAITKEHPVLRRKRTLAVNSCLVPVLACHDCEITTTHGIGNRTIGYNPIQVSLAKHNGTQCGFCSPGMTMNMYALQQSNDMIPSYVIEDSFGGSLCRCTGYRPILDAFKSLAVDADPDLVNKYPDIEDIKICSKTGKACDENCKPLDLTPIRMEFGCQMKWFVVYNINEILDLFKAIGNSPYRLVAGNTGQGVYPITSDPEYWIDIQWVKELISYETADSVTLGANVTITDTMDLFRRLSEENGNYWYLGKVWTHLDLVAHVPVRNIGTLGGNLSLKHDHHEFPSDIFLLFETLDAKITIVTENGNEVVKSPAEYIDFDMNKCVMKSIKISPIEKATHFFESYKICPRVQNAHAYENAAFLVKHDSTGKVVNARIVYGGISPTFIHAKNTESYLVGKNLFDNATIQGALESLTKEVNPDYVLPESTPEFRKNLARNLFYKFILASAPQNKINPKYQTGGTRLQRGLARGTQFYQTDPSMYPVTEPVNKIEGLMQCAGEAQYIDDMPAICGELFAALVLAETVPGSRIISKDASEALKQPGVEAFLDYKDIPGKNEFTTPTLSLKPELLFCEDTVQYNGQPVGLIIAQTEDQANAAVSYVKITYEKTATVPEYYVKDIIEKKEKSRIENITMEKPTRKGNNIKHVIKGTVTMKEQYHFQMETQRCICIPTDDGGIDMYASTQWINLCQVAAAEALNLSVDKINVYVKRLGSAYGSKIVRSSMISTSCAIAAYKMQRPVRLLTSLHTNMKAIGKRFPTYATYEVAVDDKGVIQNLECDYYQACGMSGRNEQKIADIADVMKSVYTYDTWKLSGNLVYNDMAGNAFCRAPGSVEGSTFIEVIMDHISHETGIDPVKVRQANIHETEDKELEFVKDMVNWSDFYKRVKKVQDYNDENRWMKKGINITLMNFRVIFLSPLSALISVFAADGTVAISHGGIECGQGLNTKVVQVCAYMLKIPMSMISIKPNISFVNPNNYATGGSITSEAICFATIQACKILLNRLQPVRDSMNDPTWPELIAKAYKQDVELVATASFISNSEKPYSVIGACVSEVDVDLLTGEHVVQRVDLIEDVGKSMSPAIDAGQIEGAFIMGLGDFTCENLIYGDEGQLLTYNTWNYKIPGAKDIPVDFRIQFRQNSSNPNGVLNSKATGEPAICLSVCVPLAIRNALYSGAKDAKKDTKKYLDIDGPTTVEYTLLNASSDCKTFTL